MLIGGIKAIQVTRPLSEPACLYAPLVLLRYTFSETAQLPFLAPVVGIIVIAKIFCVSFNLRLRMLSTARHRPGLFYAGAGSNR